MRTETSKNINVIIDTIKCPRYIIYDFETDTHTLTHKPNHVEVSVLKVNESHTYDSCLVSSTYFNGYGCEDKLCDWLFDKSNANSTVIAHNGAGYDNKFILIC